MPHLCSPTRRAVLAALAAAPLYRAEARQVPVGLELYLVRKEFLQDPLSTLDSVAKVGYKGVEFWAPYYNWTPDYARQVRKKLDDLEMWCHSTHNDRSNFQPDNLGKAIELNKILGTRFVVMSWASEKTLDGWKKVADELNAADDTLAQNGLHSGYHNHEQEWQPIDGQRPIDVIARNTHASVMLQFDVGTCVASGSDPVAYIKQYSGRIKSMHLKDWGPQGKYSVLFGEGVTPWKEIFAAAESNGVQYYLIEQEGSRYPELETVKLCLENYRKIHG